MPSQPDVVHAPDLSTAWRDALERALQRSHRSLAPLLIVVSASGTGDIVEQPHIRRTVDHALLESDCYSVSISGSTIFPYKSWIRANKPNRHIFFTWYLTEYLPRLKARDPRNQHGTYFERMIAFSGVRTSNATSTTIVRNQLDHIINDWTRPRSHPKRPRQSALQVSLFDPVKDHTGQSVRGFPCLQQVSFAYDDSEGLAVNAYYPTQYVFDRGYGNYLGLCHLGIFMAHELGLRFSQLNCYVAQPFVGSISKTAARTLLKGIGTAAEPGIGSTLTVPEDTIPTH